MRAQLAVAVDAEPALVAVTHVIVVVRSALAVAMITALHPEAVVNCGNKYT